MVGKRGYLRILEAIIAIVMIFGILLYVGQKESDFKTDVPSVVSEAQRVILDEIAFDEKFVDCVLFYVDGTDTQGVCSGNTHGDGTGFDCNVEMDILINKHLPIGYDYTCEICEESLSCLGGDAEDIPSGKSVYTSTTFLAGNGDNEKVIRLYFWLKSEIE